MSLSMAPSLLFQIHPNEDYDAKSSVETISKTLSFMEVETVPNSAHWVPKSLHNWDGR